MNDSRDTGTTYRETTATSSPWRQPVVWLMVALVLAAVGGGISLVVIASGDGATDAVADDVRRTAQVQTVDLSPDEVARERGLSAVVRMDAGQELVQVLPVSGDFDRAAPLRLKLEHPTRAAADRELVLQPGELGWSGEAVLEGGHDWLVELGPADGEWRLQGRLPKGQRAAHLHPALAGE
jgi:hypothetical protein